MRIRPMKVKLPFNFYVMIMLAANFILHGIDYIVTQNHYSATMGLFMVIVMSLIVIKEAIDE